jgi:hypothetical protein
MNPVQEQLEAYNAHDLERFARCFAPQVVVEDAAGTIILTGLDSLCKRYGPLFASSPDLHCRLGRRIQVGAHVIDEEFVTGMNMPGAPAEIHAAVIYHVIDGKINRMRALS